MEEKISNSDSAVNNKQRQRNCWWDRGERANKFKIYNSQQKQGLSQRKIAAEIEVPRTTLQEWKKCGERIDDDPAVVAFFESPQGVAVLHRMITALHLVFVEVAACGIRNVSTYLNLTGLNRYVASGRESQRKINISVQTGVLDHTTKERERLSTNMEEKDITAAQDETYEGSTPCLVAIEPVSNFILLEQQAEGRDAETWNAAMKEATKGLKCNIVQVVGDQGKGLVSYANNFLNAQHSPDLFHVQQDISRAVSAPIAAKVRAAENQLKDAEEDLKKIMTEALGYQKDLASRDSGHPPNFEAKINTSLENISKKKEEAERLSSVRDELREGNKKLGNIYHYANLQTGEKNDEDKTISNMQIEIAKIREAAKAEGLKESSIAMIDKAARVLPKMKDTLKFVSAYIKGKISKMPLNTTDQHIVYEKLIPSFYVERIGQQKKNVVDKKPLLDLASELRAQLFEEGSGELKNLSKEIKSNILNDSKKLSNIFQRSSSCVEGRNGVLSFRCHELKGIHYRKRKVLTAIHNYFIERRDRTTAAERFFGSKPEDMFEAILNSVDIPMRPRISMR